MHVFIGLSMKKTIHFDQFWGTPIYGNHIIQWEFNHFGTRARTRSGTWKMSWTTTMAVIGVSWNAVRLDIV
jgi:hypothetical protein